MADQLKVSTDQLKNTSREFSSRKKELEGICSQMSGIAKGTPEYWRGNANDAFVAKFSAMYDQLRETDVKMQDAVDELLKAAGIFEESESRNSTAMQSLDTGTSPFLA